VRRPTVLLASLALLLAAAVALARRRRRGVRPLPAPPPAPPALPPGPRFVSIAWTLVAAPAERAELTLRYASTEHMELDRVDAQETPTQVFVTVLMRRRPPAGGSLAWEPEHEATVALSAPLAGRELVHAPVDLEAPAEGPGDPPLYP
jgi:hypothetical protein